MDRSLAEEPAEVPRADAVDVLLRAELVDRAEEVERGRERMLDEDPVDRRVPVERAQRRAELFGAIARLERDVAEGDPERGRRLPLAAEVEPERAVPASMDADEGRRRSSLPDRLDARAGRPVDRLGDRSTLQPIGQGAPLSDREGARR
jgi:hypothetical protein